MNLPDRTKEAIDLYVSDGVDPGYFLQSVLENNLMEAVGFADETNRDALFEICYYVHDQTPLACHGSAYIYRRWMEIKEHDRSTAGPSDRSVDGD